MSIINFIKVGIKPFIFFPLDKPFLWKCLRGILTTAPVIIFSYISYSYCDIKSSNIQNYLKALFEKNCPILITLIASPFFESFLLDLYEDFARFIKFGNNPSFQNDILSHVMGAIRLVVAKKIKRFGDQTMIIRTNKSSASETFFTITQPLLQITELITQLTSLLNKIIGIRDLKLVLTSVKNNVPQEYIYYFPEEDRPSNEILRAKQSFFQSILACKKFIFIDDIEKYHNAKPKKLKGKAKAIHFCCPKGYNAVGSIGGMPIAHKFSGEIVYLLTFRSNTPKIIDNKFETKYNLIIKEFIDRILLENYLMEIKTNVTK